MFAITYEDYLFEFLIDHDKFKDLNPVGKLKIEITEEIEVQFLNSKNYGEKES